MKYEWSDVDGDTGFVSAKWDSRLIAMRLGEDTGDVSQGDDGVVYAGNYLTPIQARALAGALLAAAEHIDPLPATTPNPASTPDQLM